MNYFRKYLRTIWQKHKNKERNTVGKLVECVCQTWLELKIKGLKMSYGVVWQIGLKNKYCIFPLVKIKHAKHYLNCKWTQPSHVGWAY